MLAASASVCQAPGGSRASRSSGSTAGSPGSNSCSAPASQVQRRRCGSRRSTPAARSCASRPTSACGLPAARACNACASAASASAGARSMSRTRAADAVSASGRRLKVCSAVPPAPHASRSTCSTGCGDDSGSVDRCATTSSRWRGSPAAHSSCSSAIEAASAHCRLSMAHNTGCRAPHITASNAATARPRRRRVPAASRAVGSGSSPSSAGRRGSSSSKATASPASAVPIAATQCSRSAGGSVNRCSSQPPSAALNAAYGTSRCSAANLPWRKTPSRSSTSGRSSCTSAVLPRPASPAISSTSAAPFALRCHAERNAACSAARPCSAGVGFRRSQRSRSPSAKPSSWWVPAASASRQRARSWARPQAVW